MAIDHITPHAESASRKGLGMHLERTAMKKLMAWKTGPHRKPMLLRGARQTGKTWITERFAADHYDGLARIDFMRDEAAKRVFEQDLDPRRIIRYVSALTKTPIQPEHTLIVFDEVQECPRALTSLKYFCEEAPEYQIIATGSYMGIASHQNDSFPVGKVDLMTLHPLTFMEFLRNAGEPMLADELEQGHINGIDAVFGEKLRELLKLYMFVGGMPEAVSRYLEHEDLNETREVQRSILDTYDADFSKHAPIRLLERLRLTWNSIPAQLARENRKFMYGLIRTGARAREFEECLQWLRDYGIITKVPCLSAIRKPLSGYAQLDTFKVYLVDTGLLGALSDLDPSAIVHEDQMFTEFKGALTEQYVCQQLVGHGLDPFYWANPSARGTAEVDFVTTIGGQAVPIEVKAKTNLRAKSLHVAAEKYGIAKSVRTSLAGYRDEGWVVNVPLWAIGTLPSLM